MRSHNHLFSFTFSLMDYSSKAQWQKLCKFEVYPKHLLVTRTPLFWMSQILLLNSLYPAFSSVFYLYSSMQIDLLWNILKWLIKWKCITLNILFSKFLKHFFRNLFMSGFPLYLSYYSTIACYFFHYTLNFAIF